MKKSKEIKGRENSINSIRKSSLYVIIAHLKFASHLLHSGKQFTKRGKKKERNNPNSIESTVKNLFKITQMCKDFLKDKN